MSSTFSNMGFENPILKGTFIELGVFITVNFSNPIYISRRKGITTYSKDCQYLL